MQMKKPTAFILNRMIKFGYSDADIKQRWLSANEYKMFWWGHHVPLKELMQVNKDMIENNQSDVEGIANWMIKERVVSVKENCICLRPGAFCWATGHSLFLRRATKVTTAIDGPGDRLWETFYFIPKQYTLWLLKT